MVRACRWWIVALLCTLLLACSSAVRFQEDAIGTYTVRRGDTLYSIAWRNGLDWRSLAQWNGVSAPYSIALGQKLRLTAPPAAGAARTAPARAPSVPSSGPPSRLAWSWPADGRVVAAFRDGSATGKGIDIAGVLGADVRAASDGKVVYVGSGLVGYGKVIIVKHDDRYLSAYAHNDRFLVGEGDLVKRGQRIAAMGIGSGQRPLLHFEIRLDGRAVDPARLLPKR